MDSLQYDTTYMPKFGKFTEHKKERGTAIDTPPQGNAQWIKKINTIKPSSMTDTFNNDNPKQTAKNITRKTNADRETNRESTRLFMAELENRKREEENARNKNFR